MALQTVIPQGQGKRKAKDLNAEALKKLKAIEEQGGITIRLLVTKAQVGAIIGRGGENVKRLRNENDVFVSVLWSKHKERVAEYKGIVQNLAAAVRQTAEFFGPEGDSKEYCITFLVHSQQVGCLIGKGGVLSKQCHTETGARLEVSRDKKGESTEKTVSLTGPLESIRPASEWVLNQLNSNPLRPEAQIVPYKPTRLSFPGPRGPAPAPPLGPPGLFNPYPYYQPFPPEPASYRQYTPFGAPQGASSPGPTPGSPHHPTSAPMTPGSPYHPSFPIGPPSSASASRFTSPQPNRNPYSIGDLMSPAMSTYSPQTGGGPEGMPGAGTPGNSLTSPSQPRIPPFNLPDLKIRSTTELNIPLHCIPGLIGRGGSVIQNIHRQTQASIKIAEQVDGDKFRVATITGSETAIRNAVQLIQNRIAELNLSPTTHPPQF